jgi:CBS domain-containing protein
MAESDTGDVVITENGRLLGILTDRDIAIRVVAEGLDPEVAVSEVCTGNPVTVAPDDELTTASQLMREHSIRRLPVCEGSEVVGFISLGDLSQFSDADATLSDISSAPAQR